MRVSLFLLAVVFLNGCYSYPKFNLREPIYLIVSPEYTDECVKRGIRVQCEQSLRESVDLWFSNFVPEDRPKVVLLRSAMWIEPKNEPILVEYDPTSKAPAYFRWTSRPLMIVIGAVLLGPIARFFLAHEFGHAILGPRHEPAPSMMQENGALLRPNAGDINRLCRKYPYLRCIKK